MAAITNEILGKKRKGEKDEDRETDRNLKKNLYSESFTTEFPCQELST